MELKIKSHNTDSNIYSSVEFQLNGTLVADFLPLKKMLLIYDTDLYVYTKKCATLHAAINQVVKFHKKNF